MTSLSLHLPKPNLCLCCTPSPFYNWHSNTSEMKYWHLAPVTLHNNTYCIPHTSLSTAAAGCACVDENGEEWKKKGGKKRDEKERKRYDLSVSSIVGASVLSVWICSCSLHWALNHWRIFLFFFVRRAEPEEWERVPIGVLQGHPCGSWSTHLVH